LRLVADHFIAIDDGTWNEGSNAASLDLIILTDDVFGRLSNLACPFSLHSYVQDMFAPAHVGAKKQPHTLPQRDWCLHPSKEATYISHQQRSHTLNITIALPKNLKPYFHSFHPTT
jgi:hypothetical protein